MLSFKKNIFLLAICLMALPLAGICQLAPSAPKWLADMGGPNGSSTSTMMKVDAQNNIYVIGTYTGTVDFDPSAGVNNLTSVNSSVDGFVTKYDTNGALMWAVSIGGTGTDQPNALTIDGSGNITVTGQFNSPTLSAGGFNLTSAGGADAFIIHLNNNGSFLWAKSIGGSGIDNGSKVVSDNAGNLVEAVQFQSTIKVNSNGSIITAQGATDGLVIKYDAAGNVLWDFSLGSPGGGDNSVNDVLIDNNKNIVIAGYLNGTVHFNPLGSADSVRTGNNSMYIAQYSPAGILIWVQVITSISTNFNYNINICADNQNNIYVDGMFADSLNFGTAAILTPAGSHDIFFAKYSTSGVFQWYEDIGGAGSSINSYGLVMGIDNNIYITGYFSGTIYFNPFNSSVFVSDHGIGDMFLAKYDVNGIYQWAFGLGNNSCNNNIGRFAAINSNNDILLTGSFCSTVNFDGSNCGGSFTATAQSSVRDLFIAKYTPNVVILSKNVISAPQGVVFCGPGNPSVLIGNIPTGGGAITYQWQKSPDNKTYTAMPGVNSLSYNPPLVVGTTFYRRLAYSGTCATPVLSNVIPITFSLDPPVSNNIISQPNPDPPFCGGNAHPSAINGALPTGGTNKYSYQWQKSTDNINFTDIVGDSLINYHPTVIATTTYFRRVVVSGVCAVPSKSNVIPIIINSLTLNNIITPPAVVSFCVTGDPDNLVGSVPSGGNGAYTYQWQSSTDSITFINIPQAISRDYDPPVINTTTYYRRMATSAVCSTPVASNTVTITVNPPFAINKSAVTICSGSSVALNATGGTLFNIWSPAIGLSNTTIPNPIASPLVTTTYTVLIDNGTCNTTKTVTITVIPKPTVDAGQDIAILGGGKAQLNGVITGNNFQYSWSPTTYLDNPNSLSPVSTPLTDMTYTLTATSELGCFIVSAKVSVKVYNDIVIPNTFTPNGDGINDTWDIGVLNTNSNIVITVYNRNGTPVFKSVGYTKRWDGKYNGSPLPFGTYYYTIDLKNGSKPLSGWVSLIK